MIKECHVSKNLFFSNNSNSYSGTKMTVQAAENSSEYILNASSHSSDRSAGVVVNLTLPAGTYTVCLTGLIRHDNDYDRMYLRKSDSSVLINNIQTDRPRTFTITEQTTIDRISIILAGDSVYTNSVIKVWLVSGSYTIETMPPYEPYGNRWNTKSYAKIVDTTQQVTSFPVVVRPMENTIPSWTIKGNMVQDGTPSPSNIIYPSETGERTGNLFDKTDTSLQSHLYYNSNNNTLKIGLAIGSIVLPCSPNTTYTIKRKAGISDSFDVCYTTETPDENVSAYGYVASSSRYSYTLNITTGANAAYLIIVMYNSNFINPGTWQQMIDNLVVVEGTTVPSTYIPHGYKLDIKSGNTTTPVYLGQVQSTRNVYKYEFTGSEPWELHPLYANLFRISSITDYKKMTYNVSRCSHYNGTNTVTGAAAVVNKQAAFYHNSSSPSSIAFYIKDTTFSTAADFKTYLQQQYAAGTPVTIWYVLANETTGVVNEPLRKIGDYADSVSGTNLSVTAHSPTTIDVDTTLKPSEMDLTYTGLKMCGRKKYAGLLADNPLCGIGTRTDTLDLSTGTVTRVIKKVVLTGYENIKEVASYKFRLPIDDAYRVLDTTLVCSHFSAITNSPYTDMPENSCMVLLQGQVTTNLVYVTSSSTKTVNDFKVYLRQRYAAGKPVTLWYFANSTTTETITVPSGLSGTEVGYLNQSGTPTPTNPIYPTANSVPYWQ